MPNSPFGPKNGVSGSPAKPSTTLAPLLPKIRMRRADVYSVNGVLGNSEQVKLCAVRLFHQHSVGCRCWRQEIRRAAIIGAIRKPNTIFNCFPPLPCWSIGPYAHLTCNPMTLSFRLMASPMVPFPASVTPRLKPDTAPSAPSIKSSSPLTRIPDPCEEALPVPVMLKLCRSNALLEPLKMRQSPFADVVMSAVNS